MNLRELEAAATPGPWEEDGGVFWQTGVTAQFGRIAIPVEVDLELPHNAALIAALRNAAPFLLDVVDAARSQDQAHRGHFDMTYHDHEKCGALAQAAVQTALAALDAHLAEQMAGQAAQVTDR